MRSGRKRVGLLIVGLLVIAVGLLGAAGTVGAQVKHGSAGGWRKCGEFYIAGPRQPVILRAKRVPCLSALQEIAHVIVEPGMATCLQQGCEAPNFACEKPAAPGPVGLRCLGSGGRRLEIRAGWHIK